MNDVEYKTLEDLVANMRKACQSEGLHAAEIAQILKIDPDDLAAIVAGDIARFAMLEIWSLLRLSRRINLPLLEFLPTM